VKVAARFLPSAGGEPVEQQRAKSEARPCPSHRGPVLVGFGATFDEALILEWILKSAGRWSGRTRPCQSWRASTAVVTACV